MRSTGDLTKSSHSKMPVPRRLLRIWEKKRGDRSTGSATVGRVGEALFFGVLFLLGAISLAALLTAQMLDPDPRLYRFGYGFYLVVIVLTSFVIVGGGGLMFNMMEVGASVERRASLAKRAANIDLIREARTAPLDFPTVPSDANLTNSPGIQLAFRLPCLQSPVWKLSAAALFCVVWSGVAGMLLVVAINSHRAGQPQWMLTLFILPFLAGGLWAVHYFFRQLLIHTVIGPSGVEISAHPLRPGDECEIFVTQSGRLQMEKLAIWLVGYEETTFRQGTDIRNEQHVVYKQALSEHQNFRIVPSKSFEHRCRLAVPKNAMHSFHAKNNAMNWRLVLRGTAEGWPTFERAFPIIVYPPAQSPPTPAVVH